MEDLYKALIGMEQDDSDDIAARLEKFITGSYRGIFDQASNIDISSQFTVFSVKEMEESLRPIAMYVILDFIWTRVKKTLKRRILVIDEAWYFMMHPDSAAFVYSMVKRARKYYLGITTITQDVEDFLRNDYGKAIVSNASIQFLMKQSTSSIPVLTQTFYLSEGERQLLVSSDVGEGVFFAGQNHVALRVIASPEEHKVITTNPEELVRKKDEKEIKKAINAASNPRTESYEKYQKMRELRKQRLTNSGEYQKTNIQQGQSNQGLAWKKSEIDITQDPLKNAQKNAEAALKKDTQVAGQVKTIFGDDDKNIKPDNHGIYSINDYQPPK
jgi:hypothetical protein